MKRFEASVCEGGRVGGERSDADPGELFGPRGSDGAGAGLSGDSPTERPGPHVTQVRSEHWWPRHLWTVNVPAAPGLLGGSGKLAGGYI